MLRSRFTETTAAHGCLERLALRRSCRPRALRGGGGAAGEGLIARRRPLHQEVDAVRVDVLEAETLVEAEGGVEAFDMDGDGLPRRLSSGENIAHERRSDAAAAAFVDEGDVDEADLVLPLVDPDAADGLAIPLDDVALAGRVVKAVVLELRGELLIEELDLLGLVVRKVLHLLRSRGVVETAHEVVVGIGGGTENDRAGGGAVTGMGLAHDHEA